MSWTTTDGRIRLLMTVAAVALLTAGTGAIAKPNAEAAEAGAGAGEVTNALRQNLARAAQFEEEIARSAADGRPTTVRGVLDDISGRPTAERLVAWVFSHIVFEPYIDPVRPPRSVLQSGAANSIDQARLLAALFEEVGIAYRVVEGTMPDGRRVELLRGFAGGISADVAGGQAEPLTRNSEFASRRYLRRLDRHVWLEAKVDGEFAAADPVASDRVGTTFGRAERRFDEMPDRYRATVRVRLEAEFADGQHKDLLTLEGPMRSFARYPFRLDFIPTDVQQDLVVPRIERNGKVRSGERFLPSGLERLRLTYRARYGQRDERFAHDLFVRRPHSERTFRADGTATTIAVVPGWANRRTVAAMLDGPLRKARKAVRSHLRGTDGSSEEVLDRETRRDLLAATGIAGAMLYPYHLDGLAGRLGDTSGVRPILRGPRFAHTTVRADAGGVSVDYGLEGGGVGAVPKEGVSARAVRAFTSVYGYADHRLRHGLVKRVSGQSLVSMTDLFETVQREGVSVTTIHAGNVEQLDAIDVSGRVREAMRDAVRDEGRILLVPARSVAIDGRKRFGWWSVEPEGGVVRGERADLAVGFFGSGDGSDGSADVAIGETLVRTLEVTAKTFDNPTTYATVVCRGLDQLQGVGRALCARSEPRDLPDPDACEAARREENQSGGIGDVGLGPRSCAERARDARCGASAAGYLLSGMIGMGASGAEADGRRLGVPGDDRPTTGAALRCGGG